MRSATPASGTNFFQYSDSASHPQGISRNFSSKTFPNAADAPGGAGMR
jgi:hypothetical protein